jgi:phosphate-selective porin OprO/OprP
LQVRIIMICAVGLVWACAALAAPPVSSSELEELRALIQQQEATIEALKGRLDALEKRDAADTAPVPPHTPTPNAGDPLDESAGMQDDDGAIPLDATWDNGFWIKDRHDRFKLNVGGRTQFDTAFIGQHNSLRRAGALFPELGWGEEEDGIEFRRARLKLSGSIYESIDFSFEYEFATNGPNGDAGGFAYVYLRYNDIPYVGALTVGHMEEPITLDQMTSNTYLTFMERSLPNVFSPGFNAGFQARNTAWDQRMTWTLGAFRTTDSSPSDNDSNDDEAWSLTGRVTGLPWYEDEGRRLLHLGAGFSHRRPDNSVRYRARPESNLTFRYLDTGNIPAEEVNILSLESALVLGPFSLQGEYVQSRVESPHGKTRTLDGHYVMASYFLTGENRGYKKSLGGFHRVYPNENFSLRDGKRGWGAWEVATRYSTLDLNEHLVRGGEQTNWTVGLNWYLNPMMRIMVNYIHADIERGWFDGDVDVLQTRFDFRI